MKTITSGRGGGKTIELIKFAEQNNSYIVCINRREADRVFQCSKDIGCKIKFPITFDEFLGGKYGVFVDNFVIDNCDLLLQKLSRYPIKAISITQ